MLIRGTELIETIVLTDIQMPHQTAAEMLTHAIQMFALVCTDHFYGKIDAWLACLHMLRSYYLWLAREKDGAFDALNKALKHVADYDRLFDVGAGRYSAPLLRHVHFNVKKAPNQGAFRAELPEVWPWWCVPEREKVKAEMQKDPRWNEWEQKAKEGK